MGPKVGSLCPKSSQPREWNAMPNKKQPNVARRAELVREARAGLIPASDDLADEQHARMDRTSRIGCAVREYAQLLTFGSEDLAITDILTGLRHYCDSKGLTFSELDTAADEYYLEEAAENRMMDHA